MVLKTIVTGANLNQLITGGPHIVCLQPSTSAQKAAASFRTPIPVQTPHLGCPLCTLDPHGAESLFHRSLGLRRPKALALESKPVPQGRLAEAQVLNHDPWNPQIPSDILSWINFTKRAEREREREILAA